METMASYPVTPSTYSQTSHVRTNPAIAQQATRSMHAADAQQHSHQPLSTPASQESFVSTQSNGSSVRQPLQNSSSNLSQLTNYTDPTSPVTSAPKQQYGRGYTSATSAASRARTPENALQNPQPNGEYALASPMSVTSPVSTNGAKRTASGHVKNVPSLPSTPMTATFGGRSRAESMSSTGSRAGELAATLKTRLGYAMAKVQHGWEHKTIAEVEHLAAQKMSPNRHSMSHVDYSTRPVSAGLSNGTSRMSMHEYYPRPMTDGTTSPPSKRRSGTYASFLTSPQQRGPPALGAAPHLQPPADILPTSSAHSYYTAPSTQSSHHSGNAMSPPRTPLNGQPRRPPTIRTDTQTAEAERDALQALFQLGSPHASQVSRHTNASQASSNQASPLRTEFPTPRRVTFAQSDSGSSSARASSAEGSIPDA